MKQTGALKKAGEGAAPTIKDFLRAKKAVIGQALEGTALSPERLLSVAMLEIRKNPKLAECTRDSLFGSLVQAAQLGLEPGGALGQCYLIPFYNRRLNVTECQFVVGYKGMIDLARRSGQIVALFAHCVHERDALAVEYGLHPRLEHSPYIDGEPGAVVGAYAVAHLQGGGEQFVYLPRYELEAVRAMSAKKDGPWADHFEAMCQKTAVRRLCKWLPVSVEARIAAALDEQAERGERQHNAALFDQEGVEIVDAQSGEVRVASAADLNGALS